MMVDMFSYYLDNNCGILIRADKTSSAVGINNEGEKLYIGGWGTRLGEDGSEYYIGLQAIKAVISEYELLEAKTMLTEAVKKQLKVKDIEELKNNLCFGKISDKKICSISEDVLNCALLGDRISINIVSKASEKLFNMVDIIVRRLNMYDQKYNICLTGSITRFGDYILEPLCDKIYSRYDNLQIFTYNKAERKISI